MIGRVCGELGTANVLALTLDDAIDPLLLPAALFLLAGAVAFSTGSSWSTMTILLPLVVGLAFRMGEGTDLGGQALMVLSIGAVLEGAIFGDHCSPISDTTVMSSVASGSDHIDHVRTQAPYALLTMAVALGVGYLPCAYLGLHPGIALAAGTAVLAALVFLLGRRSDA
jgi:Na+/H+ antiporter NhaC